MLLIKGGTIIRAEDTLVADILISKGRIVEIIEDKNTAIDMLVKETVDASNKLIMPGGVDVHTHFDLPMFGTVSSDDHYSGHKAAAFGGTTTVMDFVPMDSDDNNIDSVDIFKYSVDLWRKSCNLPPLHHPHAPHFLHLHCGMTETLLSLPQG